MNKVERFIDKFKFCHAKELEEVFTKGNCYYFAVILKDRFDGDIYYLPIDNHFICKIEDKYYDITGKVKPTEIPIPWIIYKKKDEAEAKRIIRDCIKFKTR